MQVIAQMTPPAIANTGWKIYLLFCFMTALSIPFVYFFMPEVRGPLAWFYLSWSRLLTRLVRADKRKDPRRDRLHICETQRSLE